MKKGLLALIFSLTFLLCSCEGGMGGLSGSDTSNPSSQNSQSSSIGEDDHSSNDTSSGDEEENYVEHVDEDDNGVCDDCKQSVLATFDFYAINDIHGKFVDNDSQPGVDELTTYLKQAKANNPNTIFLSSGDTWQGMSQSNLTQGLIMTDWMNELDFASMTMGNHEFDWGEEAILANAELAEFPFLALNIFDSETNELVEYCQPSVMVSQKGVNIGIIGAIGDCYSSIAGDKREGFYFKTGSQLTELVKAESDKLREEGADFIVYSIHDGSGGYDDALADYVDIVFEGHSHQAYVKEDNDGIYHLQGGGDNSGISHAKVVINYANETSNVSKAEVIRSSIYDNCEKDPIVNQLLEKYADQISIADQVVGYNETFRSSDYLCDKVAELYYQTGIETWGKQYDIALGGAFLQARSPYDLAVGDIKYSDLHGIFPFDNPIVLCAISGSKLQSRFLNPADRYHTYIPADVYADLSANLDYNATYYIVTDTYTSTYAANGLTEVERYDEITFARDLLAEYAKAGGFGEKQEAQFKTIPELLAICEALAYNEESKPYLVEGKITSISSASKYGNMYIEDEEGNTLYVYGTWDETGSLRYGDMSKKPQVGDTVVLYGGMKNYLNYNTNENTLEMINAWIMEWGTDLGGNGGDNNDDNVEDEIPTSDPYVNMTAAEFYANYTVAKNATDAYYRSLHGFMSGELTVPDQAPTLSSRQPTKDGDYVRNSQTLYSEDGNAYTVVDGYGNEAFKVYRDGAYITLEEVAAFVYAFGTYPANYTTSKNTDPDNSVWGEYLRVNHTAFSGDTRRYPYEPVLPNISGCGGDLNYYEMDIGTTGTDCDPNYTAQIYNDGHTITRGAARIVYGKKDLDEDGVYELGEWHVFYTYNHYNDFQEYLNYEGGWGEIFGNITGGGTISSKYDYNPTEYEQIYMGLLTEEYDNANPSAPTYPLKSIPELIAIGESLNVNEVTAVEYYVQGKIIDTPNATWGNMTIQDENGNTLWIYGVYDETGNRYDAMSNPPKQGDTVILRGVVMHYYNPSTGERKIEISQATVCSIA